MDVWGPYRVPASCGAVYFLTVVDDYSRAVWTYLLLAKSEVKKVLQRFCAYAEKQFGHSVQTVRSNNGTEFVCLGKYFQDSGIVHQTTCVDTLQQNGHVERKHMHILNVARALLFQSSLLVKFWGEAILTTTHVINMTPSKVLKGSSPNEMLFGAKPAYEMLRVFGSLYYVHRRDRVKDKLGERSRRCVFVGYPFGKKAWRVYDVEKKEFVVSRDISFSEEEFPFREKQNKVVEQVQYTGTPDDDWILNVSEENRGSEPNEAEETSIPLVVASGDTEKQSKEVETEDMGAMAEVVELGRGHRGKIPSVKLRDYVSYNAQYLKTPHHDLAVPPLESESSTTIQGNTPYPLEDYISDERFSPDHKAFLAAITAGKEPRNYKEAVQ